MDLKNELEDLYNRWLLDEYPDEIGNKDELIEKSGAGYMRDEFDDAVRASLREK